MKQSETADNRQENFDRFSAFYTELQVLLGKHNLMLSRERGDDGFGDDTTPFSVVDPNTLVVLGTADYLADDGSDADDVFYAYSVKSTKDAT